MNKASLIATVADKMGVSKVEATKVIETLVGIIVEATKVEGECVVPGLGKLVRTKTASRSGVTKGVKWEKPEGETIKLRLSKSGKEVL